MFVRWELSLLVFSMEWCDGQGDIEFFVGSYRHRGGSRCLLNVGVKLKNRKEGNVMRGGSLIWTIVGVLAIIALVIFIASSL